MQQRRGLHPDFPSNLARNRGTRPKTPRGARVGHGTQEPLPDTALLHPQACRPAGSALRSGSAVDPPAISTSRSQWGWPEPPPQSSPPCRGDRRLPDARAGRWRALRPVHVPAPACPPAKRAACACRPQKLKSARPARRRERALWVARWIAPWWKPSTTQRVQPATRA